MKLERIILTSIFVLVVFLAIIALFLYKSFTPGTNQNRDNDRPSETINTDYQPTDVPDATTNDDTNVPAQADTHTVLDGCITLKASEAAGKDYERGSLLVTFATAMDYNTAVSGIRLLGIDPDTSVSAKENFEIYRWLPVSVPEGEEFEWQCLLDISEGIRSANLNVVFRLRQ